MQCNDKKVIVMVITESFYLTSDLITLLHYFPFKKTTVAVPWYSDGYTIVVWYTEWIPWWLHIVFRYLKRTLLVPWYFFVTVITYYTHSTALNHLYPLHIVQSVFIAVDSMFFTKSSFSLFFSHPLIAAGEELLGNEGARYLKMEDLKDLDEDFLSPKNVLEYEGELQWLCWRWFRFNKKRHMYKVEGSLIHNVAGRNCQECFKLDWIEKIRAQTEERPPRWIMMGPGNCLLHIPLCQTYF